MKNLSITVKLMIFVSILGIVSVFAIAYISITATNKILNQTAVDQLGSIENIKKFQVENYLNSCMNSAKVIKMMPTTAELFSNLKNKTKKPSTQELSRIIESFGASNNLKNIFFYDVDVPTVIYSTSSTVRSSGRLDILNDLWEKCRASDKSIISDLSMSGNNAENMYVGVRIMEKGKVIGIVISEINVKPIFDFLNNDNNLTETRETYLIGNDKLTRSPLRFNTKRGALSLQVNTVASKKVFEGYSGTEILTDYRGREVLSTYNLIDVEGLNWAIISEIDTQEIYSARDSLVRSITIVSIIVLMVMFPALFFIGKLLSKPLKLEIDYAKKLADGYLDAELLINQKDEIGILAESMRQMSAKTKEVIVSVLNAANNLADASFQISSSSQDISSGASQQASSIEEVSASIEQMTSNIQQNADNAGKTEEITKNVNIQVTDGSKIVLSSVEAMEMIAEKISIISDIAFQTNILALNASVEAARAGEYGKGFGVVALEVGKLADKTKAAALEINGISKSSVEVAEKTKTLMSNLVPAINTSSLLVQEISAASSEQKDAANQINKAIQLLNDISQQNAASSEEMATNSEELSGQAEQLLNVIAHFKIDSQSIHERRSSAKSNRLLSNKSKTQASNHESSFGGIKINLDDDKNLDDEFERF